MKKKAEPASANQRIHTDIPPRLIGYFYVYKGGTAFMPRNGPRTKRKTGGLQIINAASVVARVVGRSEQDGGQRQNRNG
jgi:hypothetical protein